MDFIASTLPVWLVAVELCFLLPGRLVESGNFDFLPFKATTIEGLTQGVKDAPEFNSLVDRVSGQKGLVLAESMDVAVLGDQRIRIEPYPYSLFEEEGIWDSRPLVDQICTGQVSLLVLSYPLDKVPDLEGFPTWPRSVIAALQDSMDFEQIRAYHWIYQPRPSLDATQVAQCKSDAAAARTHS
jgi:hypothetical protein